MNSLALPIHLGKRLALLMIGLSLLAGAQTANTRLPTIQSLIRSRQYDEALRMSDAALRQSPGDYRVWALEGIVFSLQGSREPALRAFDHALRFSPDYPMALKGKVQLLYGAHDKRALPLLERILKVDPNDATAQEMLANLEARQGNCERAIRQFTALADHIHTHPESLAAYGNCLVQANQAERAIPVFTRLAALLPQQTYPK
jgi:cytochrome c-type biogenesis protein CcmH/NrfG